jgi:hypothetical protein
MRETCDSLLLIEQIPPVNFFYIKKCIKRFKLRLIYIFIPHSPWLSYNDRQIPLNLDLFVLQEPHTC